MTKNLVKEIELKNFKSFKNFKVELSDRLTLIIGRNGSGKTNLIKAIEFIFEDKNPTNIIMNGENLATVKIILYSNNKTFSIQKQITSDNIQSYYLDDKEISLSVFKTFLKEQGIKSLPTKIYDSYDAKLDNSDTKKFANKIIESAKDIQHLVITNHPELYPKC